MRVRHRYAFNRDAALEAWLRERGVRLEPGQMCVAHVYEDDIRWREVEGRLRALGHSHPFIYTEWSAREIAAAEWLQLNVGSVDAIEARPDDWSARVYSDPCRCGWRGPQIGPYRLKGLPKWRRSGRSFTLGNWPEEMFVDAPVQRAIEGGALRGVTLEPVLRHRDGALLSIAQVRVGLLREGAVVEQDLKLHRCRRGHRWFEAKDRGPLRLDGEALHGAPDVVQTVERFGNEFWGARALLARQRAAQVLRAAAVHGLSLAPIEIA